ncbi:MAG: 5-methylcytosine restriction system specificity protein McrC [Phocaeicola sp.]
MIQLQEHDFYSTEQRDRYENLELIQWGRPMVEMPLGYYALYKIGAEWVDDKEAIIVTTKRKMESIDFLQMFVTCFSSNLALDAFSKIYTIETDKPAIYAPVLKGVVSPLIIFHFLGVVSRIKSLRKGYVHHSENLKKIKGRIRILKNERLNILTKRFDRIFCNFDEYSIDIPENRLIKKALAFSQRLLNSIGNEHASKSKINLMLSKSMLIFEQVSDLVEIKEVGQIRSHKLFSEYSEAIRLAKIILNHYDYSIRNISKEEGKVTPFVLDMSLLYEHYVYGLLNEAYNEKILYQFRGKTGIPDFLYSSDSFKAILDAKYIPKYDIKSLDKDVIWQLSGYSRDLRILKGLGFIDLTEESPIPNVPCVIIYPKESDKCTNLFLNKALEEVLISTENGLCQFYKIVISIPTL